MSFEIKPDDHIVPTRRIATVKDYALIDLDLSKSVIMYRSLIKAGFNPLELNDYLSESLGYVLSTAEEALDVGKIFSYLEPLTSTYGMKKGFSARSLNFYSFLMTKGLNHNRSKKYSSNIFNISLDAKERIQTISADPNALMAAYILVAANVLVFDTKKFGLLGTEPKNLILDEKDLSDPRVLTAVIAKNMVLEAFNDHPITPCGAGKMMPLSTIMASFEPTLASLNQRLRMIPLVQVVMKAAIDVSNVMRWLPSVAGSDMEDTLKLYDIAEHSPLVNYLKDVVNFSLKNLDQPHSLSRVTMDVVATEEDQGGKREVYTVKGTTIKNGAILKRSQSIQEDIIAALSYNYPDRIVLTDFLNYCDKYVFTANEVKHQFLSGAESVLSIKPLFNATIVSPRINCDKGIRVLRQIPSSSGYLLSLDDDLIETADYHLIDEMVKDMNDKYYQFLSDMMEKEATGNILKRLFGRVEFSFSHLKKLESSVIDIDLTTLLTLSLFPNRCFNPKNMTSYFVITTNFELESRLSRLKIPKEHVIRINQDINHHPTVNEMMENSYTYRVHLSLIEKFAAIALKTTKDRLSKVVEMGNKDLFNLRIAQDQPLVWTNDRYHVEIDNIEGMNDLLKQAVKISPYYNQGDADCLSKNYELQFVDNTLNVSYLATGDLLLSPSYISNVTQRCFSLDKYDGITSQRYLNAVMFESVVKTVEDFTLKLNNKGLTMDLPILPDRLIQKGVTLTVDVSDVDKYSFLIKARELIKEFTQRYIKEFDLTHPLTAVHSEKDVRQYSICLLSHMNVMLNYQSRAKLDINREWILNIMDDLIKYEM
jgi:hypothetical protein